LLILVLAYAVYAAFFATRYTTYHTGLNWLVKLNFCLFVVVMNQTALAPWCEQWVPMVVTATYLVLLAVAYLFACRRERRTNWGAFAQTLASPTFVIEKGHVRRLARRGAATRQNSSSRAISGVGAGLGVAALSLVGALFGAKGKELLLLAVASGFLVAPFFLLRYIAIYSIGIREIKKVERERSEYFEIDNVFALQEERRRILLARLLNPRLREQP
jgi:uncharacterized membrane protein YbhN (UPF0104 family)